MESGEQDSGGRLHSAWTLGGVTLTVGSGGWLPWVLGGLTLSADPGGVTLTVGSGGWLEHTSERR